MEHAQIQELGSLSSCSVTFITRRTVKPHVPSLMPTPWTALSSADLLPPMQSWSTTHEINVSTNQTAIDLIHFASRPKYIQPYGMTEAYLSPFTATTSQSSVNLTFPGCTYLMSTQRRDSLAPAPSWTFPLTQQNHCTT